jgi:hypothetical protein
MMLWFPFTLFGVMWLLITISNVSSLIDARRYGDSDSLTLFLGGGAGVIAVLICPIPDIWIWAWVPALLDPGCIPAFLRNLYGQLIEKRKH